MSDRRNEIARCYGMEINVKKSKVMGMSNNNP
jgi:hypothetical protein